jgi:hypothetical protein
VQGLNEFFHQMWRELLTVWDLITVWLISVFEPQSGWQPKAIFGGILLFVIFWVAKRGTKS